MIIHNVIQMEPSHSIEAVADVVLLNEQPTAPATEEETVYTVTDFVTQYKQSLPQRIKVVEGFCGKEERYNTYTNNCYN